jgi:hypothetical protein
VRGRACTGGWFGWVIFSTFCWDYRHAVRSLFATDTRRYTQIKRDQSLQIFDADRRRFLISTLRRLYPKKNLRPSALNLRKSTSKTEQSRRRFAALIRSMANEKSVFICVHLWQKKFVF